MRYLVHLVLLLTLCSTQALANGTHVVELMIFRQSSESIPASRIAPDNWANDATLVTSGMLRSTHLDHLAAKLTPDAGYEILLHKAWLQNSTDGSAQVAISEGQEYFEHFPIEGTLNFTLDRASTVQFDLWINQFNSDQTLRSSERFKQKTIVANDQVTFVDHSTLGALIRIQAVNSQETQANTANPANFE
ncbi:MAG TPA: hypothetical protein GX719_13600 [Gammaproteobacteria bacterium]|nr:hypothetical protein [Gammaproteobacteria bacterium]